MRVISPEVALSTETLHRTFATSTRVMHALSSQLNVSKKPSFARLDIALLSLFHDLFLSINREPNLPVYELAKKSLSFLQLHIFI